MSDSMFEISACEVCGNTALTPVLDLGRHPLCDDLIPVGNRDSNQEYKIDILYCDQCITAHQRYQVPKKRLFPQSYHYRSRFTADVLSGMSQLVDACAERLGTLEGKHVLDIGCNDGSLLDIFSSRGAITAGVEPTGAAADALGRNHLVINEYFSGEIADRIKKEFGLPDVITFTNVFAHIEDLGGLLDALKTVIGPSTVLVIENHYLGAVLERNQFDTFYHEHPRTYSVQSFKVIAKSLGLELQHADFPARYGGNIRVFIGRGQGPDHQQISDELKREQRFGEGLRDLAGFVDRWQASKRAEIETLVGKYGALHAKAFPGRAAILTKSLGLDTELIKCVHEKPGSMKIGHYVPGSRIEIVSDDDLFAMPELPPVIVNFAWHISDEIHAYLRKNGYAGKIVDLVDP